MFKSYKILSLLLLILLFCQAGLIILFFNNKKNELPLPRHYSYLNNQQFFQEAYEVGNPQVIEPADFVYGGIIPHHLLVKDKIAAFFFGLEKYNYQTVILLGPDHFQSTHADFSTSLAIWETPYGLLEPDLTLIQELNKQGIVIDEKPFGKEHSISGLVSFIKNSFPQTKFVPLLVNKSTSKEAAQDLASVLVQTVNNRNVLVIASVDFSHDFTTVIADQHDEVSNQAIREFDFSKIFDLDLDSPATIFTLLKYLQIQGSSHPQYLWHSNSGRIMNKLDEATTSHNFYYFTR